MRPDPQETHSLKKFFMENFVRWDSEQKHLPRDVLQENFFLIILQKSYLLKV